MWRLQSATTGEQRSQRPCPAGTWGQSPSNAGPCPFRRAHLECVRDSATALHKARDILGRTSCTLPHRTSATVLAFPAREGPACVRHDVVLGSIGQACRPRIVVRCRRACCLVGPYLAGSADRSVTSGDQCARVRSPLATSRTGHMKGATESVRERPAMLLFTLSERTPDGS